MLARATRAELAPATLILPLTYLISSLGPQYFFALPYPPLHIGAALLALLALAFAAAVAVSHIYLSYHTQKQVLVGCACGATFALVKFAFITYSRQAAWIDWALGTWLFKAFRVRDLVIQEDLVDSGWARWEDRRRRLDFRYQGKKTR